MHTIRFLHRFGLILALAAPAGVAAAQTAPDAVGPRAPQGPHARRGRRGHHRHAFRRILQELNLTENQRAQIRAIRESARERRGELRGQGRSEATRTAMRQLHRETKRLVQEVLTPAQRSEMTRLHTAHRAERITNRVNRMARHLSLTDAQKAAVTRIFENTAQRRHALRTSDQVDRDGMRALREQTRTELAGVLSEEQMQTLREHRADRRGRHGRHGRRGPRARNPAP